VRGKVLEGVNSSLEDLSQHTGLSVPECLRKKIHGRIFDDFGETLRRINEEKQDPFILTHWNVLLASTELVSEGKLHTKDGDLTELGKDVLYCFKISRATLLDNKMVEIPAMGKISDLIIRARRDAGEIFSKNNPPF